MDGDRYDDVFCVDCNVYRKQKLIGQNSYDETLLYICTECGCENSIENELKQMETNGNLGLK